MFYAVRRGRQPGIYYSWDDCREQVNGTHPQGTKSSQLMNKYNTSCVDLTIPPAHPGNKVPSPYKESGLECINQSDLILGGVIKGIKDEAASRAVEQAYDNNIRSLNVHTDSQFTIKGMTEWIPRWNKNGWKTLYGEEVVNKEEFKRLDDLCKEVDVTWTYVSGHSGNPGNEMADQLARKGAKQ